MSGVHDDIASAELEVDDAVEEEDNADSSDDDDRENKGPIFQPADFKFPAEVGSGIGKLPPYNPDAEEPSRHVYAKAHLISKDRLKTRLPPGTKTITPNMVARVKQEGVEAVEQKKWELAQSRFEDGVALMLRDVYDAERGLFKGEFAKNKDALILLNSCWLNSAMCLLKAAESSTHTEQTQSYYKRCEWHCCCAMANHGRALKPDVAAKAYFRRGMARKHLRKWVNAIADFKVAVKADPRSKEIRNALEDCIKARDKEKLDEKEFFSFDKMAKALEIKESKEKDEKQGEVWSAARLYHANNQQAEVFGHPTKPIDVMDDDVDD